MSARMGSKAHVRSRTLEARPDWGWKRTQGPAGRLKNLGLAFKAVPCDLTYMWNLMNKTETEAQTRGTDRQLSGVRGADWMKEGEGIS